MLKFGGEDEGGSVYDLVGDVYFVYFGFVVVGDLRF